MTTRLCLMSWYTITTLLLLITTTPVYSGSNSTIDNDVVGVISPEILYHFKTNPNAGLDIIVHFHNDQDSTEHRELLHGNWRRRIKKRWKRLKHLVKKLRQKARKSQKHVLKLLSHPSPTFTVRSQSDSFKSLWISNQVAIKNCKYNLIEQISHDENVDKITVDHPIMAQNIEHEDSSDDDSIDFEFPSNYPPETVTKQNFWGMDRVGISSAWTLAPSKGAGVIIGVIDSGVNLQHRDIASESIAGWKDTSDYEYEEPYDTGDHGTHVVAKLVGQNNVGIAPSASVVVCNAFSSKSVTSETRLNECAQFMLCPDNQDCKNAPHVINNSWNIDETNTDAASSLRIQRLVSTWIQKEIIPVASTGNILNPDCASSFTTTAPGTHESVITVGASTSLNTLARFSRQGDSGRNVKPDLVAPGEMILSARARSQVGYIAKNGTSFAAPFVTGTIALMLSHVQNDLSMDIVREILTSSATRENLGRPEFVCNAAEDFQTEFPNTAYGYGLLNATAAIERMISTYASINVY